MTILIKECINQDLEIYLHDVTIEKDETLTPRGRHFTITNPKRPSLDHIQIWELSPNQLILVPTKPKSNDFIGVFDCE